MTLDTLVWIKLACDGDAKNDRERKLTLQDAITDYEAFLAHEKVQKTN
jgi:hypothetical protein